MQRRWVSLVSGVTLAVALVGGVVVGPVRAQGGAPPRGEATAQGPQHGPRGQLLQAVSNLLGMTPDQLRAELQGGRSLAQIAAERGIDEATLMQTISASVRARLDEAVAAGRLTPEQADARFARLQQRLGQWITAPQPAAGTPRERGQRFRAPRRAAGVPSFLGLRGQEALDALATRLGLSGDQLGAELRGGRSLADVAAARGIDQATLLNSITDVARERLAAAVAAGRLTQQQADALLGVVQAFAPDWITRQPRAPRADERPAPPAGPRGPRARGQ